jgi:hypothetical protein
MSKLSNNSANILLKTKATNVLEGQMMSFTLLKKGPSAVVSF